MWPTLLRVGFPRRLPQARAMWSSPRIGFPTGLSLSMMPCFARRPICVHNSTAPLPPRPPPPEYEVPEAVRNRRPISPHITLYKFPLPAITSGSHRVTGFLLAGGFFAMSVIALTRTCDIPSFVEQFQLAHPILFPILKTGAGFPLVYHFASGCRHLYWDHTTRGLDSKSLEKSSKWLVGGSIAVSILLAFYSYE